jgi:hypothetical protein
VGGAILGVVLYHWAYAYGQIAENRRRRRGEISRFLEIYLDPQSYALRDAIVVMGETGFRAS